VIEAPTTLEIRLFGMPRFTYGPPLENTLPAKSLSVFAYLLLHRDRDVARDTFAFTIWPDVLEEDARANLRRALYILQHWLPEQHVAWFSANRRHVRWNVDSPYWLDVEEYEVLSQDHGQINEAVKLYSGDLLSNVEEEWIAAERDRLRDMQLRSLRRLTAQLRKTGDVPRAIECAQNALKIDPWHEEFVRNLIELRAMGGDRAGGLREYRGFEEALKREMDAAPERETIAVFERLRSGEQDDTLLPPSARAPTNNLPARLTSLIGREKEVQTLKEFVEQHRLVTIAGAGGIGKTRLALRVGADLIEKYSDGVWLVELAPISVGEFIPSAVAAALNIHESQDRALSHSIIQGLSGRHMLLIVDNCEHLIDAAASFFEDILRACPNVQILATSRQPLSIEGEHVYRTSALTFPQSSVLTATEALTYSAIELFVERALAAHHQFQLTDENAPAVGDICRRLDGIALALELAAARVRVLSVPRINDGLKARFRLLTGGSRTQLPRHQTLRALFDWSYDLLDERDKLMLRRVAVFAGGFSLEAAVATCADRTMDDVDVLDILTSLAGKSLLLAETAADTERYGVLESTREYLQERLDEQGERDAASQAHAAYYGSFAQRVDDRFHTMPQAAWYRSVSQEIENVRSALLWALTDGHDVVLGATIAGSLGRFWFDGGHLREGLFWVEQALDSLGEESRTRVAARLHLACAVLLQATNKLRAAERACDIYEEVGDKRGLGYALRQCALALRRERRWSDAEVVCRRAADFLEDVGDIGGFAMASNTLGSIVAGRGDFEHARAIHDQALTAASSHGCDYAVMLTHLYFADLDFQCGNFEQAVTHAIEGLSRADAIRTPGLVANLRCNLAIYRIALDEYPEAAADVLEALAILRDSQDSCQSAIALQHVALIDALTGNVPQAARLTGYVDRFFSANNLEREATESMGRDRLETALREHLSEAAYNALLRDGAALSEQEAIKEALDVRHVAA